MKNQTDELQALLTSRSVGRAEAAINIPGIPYGFRTDVSIDARLVVQTGNVALNTTLTLTGADQGEVALPYWTLRSGADRPGISVTTEKVTPFAASGGTSSGGHSGGSGQSSGGGAAGSGVIAIYFTVVYTIGRFLRLVFQDSSKRMIYEELPDTTLLLDLCSGIYIARIQGFLEMEYKLYYQLVQIYRSPELLLDVSRPPDFHFTPNGPNDEETGFPQKGASSVRVQGPGFGPSLPQTTGGTQPKPRGDHPAAPPRPGGVHPMPPRRSS